MKPDNLIPRILHFPLDASILEQESDPVEEGDDWEGLITRLHLSLIMSKTPALGLSAIQIGVPARVFIALLGGRVMPFVNPIIIKSYGSYEEEEEGCLSVEGCWKVKRWGSIDIKPAQIGTKNLSKIVTFHGLDARIIQHEMDHLDGRLIHTRGIAC